MCDFMQTFLWKFSSGQQRMVHSINFRIQQPHFKNLPSHFSHSAMDFLLLPHEMSKIIWLEVLVKNEIS